VNKKWIYLVTSGSEVEVWPLNLSMVSLRPGSDWQMDIQKKPFYEKNRLNTPILINHTAIALLLVKRTCKVKWERTGSWTNLQQPVAGNIIFS